MEDIYYNGVAAGAKGMLFDDMITNMTLNNITIENVSGYAFEDLSWGEAFDNVLIHNCTLRNNGDGMYFGNYLFN